MLNVKSENGINEKDMQIIEAFKKSIEMYMDNNIDELWQEVKKL